MNYQNAIQYIHSLDRFGSKLGLERMTEILKKLNNPQDKLKYVHIAGTNGKGSTSVMLSNVLSESGLKTGLYISPYVVEFEERIQINGGYIPKEKLAYYCQKVIDTKVTVTEFEFITALAFLYFADEKCDVVVLEVGLGGQFDATNIIKNPLCSVITHIDYDHTAVLGNSITKIAFEKCGIIKNGNPVVTTPYQNGEALAEIKKHTGSLSIPDLQSLKVISSDLKGNTFIYKGQKFKTSLIGPHQIENALTVIETVEKLPFDIDYEDLYKGISNTFFPARAEILSNNPTVILDGAHNPNGMKALSEVMKLCDNKITAIIGMMADKDCKKALEITLPLCSKVITVKVIDNPRTVTAEKLADIARKFCDDVTEASCYDKAIEQALKSQNAVFIFGSLYLASGIRKEIKKFIK